MKKLLALALFFLPLSSYSFSMGDAEWLSDGTGGYIRNPAVYYATGGITPSTVQKYTSKVSDASGVTLSRTITPTIAKSGETFTPSFLDTIKLSRGSIASSAGKMLLTGFVFGVGSAVGQMLLDVGIQYIDERWVVPSGVGPGGSYRIPAGVRYSSFPCSFSDSCVGSSPSEVCSMGSSVALGSASSGYFCRYTDSDGNATNITLEGSGPSTPQHYMDAPDLQYALNTASNFNAQGANAVDQIVQAGFSVDATGSESATLTSIQPSYSSAPRVTTTIVTNPDGTTTTYTDQAVIRMTPSVAGATAKTQQVKLEVQKVTTTTKDGVNQQTKTEDLIQSPQSDDTCAMGDPTCSPGSLAKPDLAEAPTIAESTASLRSRIAASALVSSVAGLASALPSGGTCPTFDLSTDFKGAHFGGVMSAHCTIFNQNYGAIHGIFLCAFAISAVILFFKA